MAKNQGYDLCGQRFGTLVVLRKGESKSTGHTSWVCRCDCGNEKTIRGDALKAGRTKSCGHCRQDEKAMQALFTFVPVPIREIRQQAECAGMTFGQYTAMEYMKRISGGG